MFVIPRIAVICEQHTNTAMLTVCRQ